MSAGVSEPWESVEFRIEGHYTPVVAMFSLERSSQAVCAGSRPETSHSGRMDARTKQCWSHPLHLCLWILDWGNSSAGSFCRTFTIAVADLHQQGAALILQVTSDPTQIPIRLGLLFMIAAIGMAIGNPIAGAILVHDDGHFWGVQVFTGIVIFTSALFYAAGRLLITGPKLLERV